MLIHLIELFILQLMSLLIYKNQTTIYPNGKRGYIRLIFTGKLAVDFNAISLFTYENDLYFKKKNEHGELLYQRVRGTSEFGSQPSLSKGDCYTNKICRDLEAREDKKVTFVPNGTFCFICR